MCISCLFARVFLCLEELLSGELTVHGLLTVCVPFSPTLSPSSLLYFHSLLYSLLAPGKCFLLSPSSLLLVCSIKPFTLPFLLLVRFIQVLFTSCVCLQMSPEDMLTPEAKEQKQVIVCERVCASACAQRHSKRCVFFPGSGVQLFLIFTLGVDQSHLNHSLL